jgi:hypothetical protein
MKHKKHHIRAVARDLLTLIHRHCLYCSNYSYSEVKRCNIPKCPLLPVRDSNLNDLLKNKGQILKNIPKKRIVEEVSNEN